MAPPVTGPCFSPFRHFGSALHRPERERGKVKKGRREDKREYAGICESPKFFFPPPCVEGRKEEKGASWGRRGEEGREEGRIGSFYFIAWRRKVGGREERGCAAIKWRYICSIILVLDIVKGGGRSRKKRGDPLWNYVPY